MIFIILHNTHYEKSNLSVSYQKNLINNDFLIFLYIFA